MVGKERRESGLISLLWPLQSSPASVDPKKRNTLYLLINALLTLIPEKEESHETVTFCPLRLPHRLEILRL